MSQKYSNHFSQDQISIITREKWKSSFKFIKCLNRTSLFYSQKKIFFQLSDYTIYYTIAYTMCLTSCQYIFPVSIFNGMAFWLYRAQFIMKNPVDQEILHLLLDNVHNFRNIYISHEKTRKMFQREFDLKTCDVLY